MKAGKIAMLIMSRGNPEKLAATILNFHGTAFNPKLIQYRVGIDDDDLETIEMVARLKGQVDLIDDIGHGRPKALGTRINRLAAIEPADYYCVLNDDVFVLGVNWDLMIRANGTLVAYWDLADCVFGADYPIISRKWYDAVDGKFFTECFPFWFDDRHLGDVFRIATMCKAFPILGVKLCARKTMTKRMRDLAFWFDYYLFLEAERMVEIAKVMRRLKIDDADAFLDGKDEPRLRVAAAIRTIHEEHREKRPAQYARFHDPSDPDPSYIAAKNEAVARMAAGWAVA